ncbi:MAG: MotA/TolQ/ExbB proton channel family protein [Spirochaetales bacterium]|nr:MotA/TolQ/ExbB proton channel family protein [Spirochaetales bacterium]
MNFIIDVFHKGGPLMWPLLICSLCSLTVTIERIIFWLREYKKKDHRFINNVLQLTEKKKKAAALKLFNEKSDMLSRVLFCGLTSPSRQIKQSMELKASEFIITMKRGLRVMETIIAVAPLLGILGTVIGIIDSFNILGLKGIAEPQGVVNGIAEALLTTAFGLLIAIVTLVPYNFFIHLVQKNADLIQHGGSRLEAALKKGNEK